MKKTASVLLILLVLLLAGCESNQARPTSTPGSVAEPTATVVPTQEAAPEPTAADAVTESAAEEGPTEEAAPEPTAAEAAADSAAEAEPTAEAAEAGDTVTSIPGEQLELMAALAPPPQLSEREPGIHTLPCFPTFSPGEDEVEGEDYSCGAFTVPQNWDEPDGRYLDLAFAVAKATGENPEPDPLIYLAGGPGSSAILTGKIDTYKELRPDRDIILLDIRCVGLSQRLGYDECLVLALQNGAPAEQVEAVAEAATILLGKASGEGGTAIQPISELNLPLLNEICWEQFTAQGIDPNQFTTAANARDVVELIKALGYESFNIDSVSYGTRLAS